MSLQRRMNDLERCASDGEEDAFEINGEMVPLSALTEEDISDLTDEQLDRITEGVLPVPFSDLTDEQLDRILDGVPLNQIREELLP